MSSAQAPRPLSGLLGPLRARLLAHSERVSRLHVDPVRARLEEVAALLDDVQQRVGRLEAEVGVVARLGQPTSPPEGVGSPRAAWSTRQATTEAAVNQLAGRLAAMRYRLEALDDDATSSATRSVPRTG